ncbi:NAD(P)H-binding protein [Herbidospora mongoliensis]|uniref:NAD(P)H-binding protein n=1 Tax=Herbidospora mongoliensis TaxID=688067 RepID=UPI00082FFBE2|nr:NAD(P)H-binding protein [Herbidospora mongoliensis]
MRVIVFGATGMVGQGVLRECLLAPDVSEVLVVGRTPMGVTDPKLTEVITDVSRPSGYAAFLQGFDAVFFCLGVGSTGMKEADYRRVTYTMTTDVARTLRRDVTFVYVSAQGADAHGRRMWARVKGETENALFERFDRAYAMRPGLIRAMHGAISKTRSYRLLYKIGTPLWPVFTRVLPRWVTTTEAIGRAMLTLARGEKNAPKILYATGINRLARM